MRATLPLLILLAFLTASCDTNEPEEEEWITPEEAIPEIEDHVATFLEEAAARNKTDSLFHPANLRIEVFDTIRVDGETLCGYGGFVPAEEEPSIQIATNRGCWDRSDWDREILVFHELGHALLGRGHKDKSLPNGLRASIMYGGTIFGLYSEMRSDHRQYYVDELFDPSTEPPDWAFDPT